MKNKLAALALVLGAVIAPASSFAATFVYVDISGNVKTVNADNQTVATFAPSDIDPHSGVMLISSANILPTGTVVPVSALAGPTVSVSATAIANNGLNGSSTASSTVWTYASSTLSASSTSR